MRAQWVCSREWRIALYKWSSINQLLTGHKYQSTDNTIQFNTTAAQAKHWLNAPGSRPQHFSKSTGTTEAFRHRSSSKANSRRPVNAWLISDYKAWQGSQQNKGLGCNKRNMDFVAASCAGELQSLVWTGQFVNTVDQELFFYIFYTQITDNARFDLFCQWNRHYAINLFKQYQ